MIKSTRCASHTSSQADQPGTHTKFPVNHASKRLRRYSDVLVHSVIAGK
jgi:hypothetical protein